MNMRNWLLIGLALMLAFTLTVGFPGGVQAQQKDPVVASGPGGQDFAGDYYGSNGSGYAYCPMGPGYGYSAPANQDYRQYASRSLNRGYQGAWCPWNSGYVRGNRGGWGCW